MPETRYEHRTDSVEEKMRLLRKAHQEGNYDLALSLSESINYTLTLERQAEPPGARAVVGAGNFGRVADLPRAWAGWARGWQYYKALAVRETRGLVREREPVDVQLDFRADQVTDPYRELRVARLDAATGALQEVPCQVCSSTYRKRVRSCRLLFLADVPPRTRAEYLVLYGNPAAELPAYTTDLTVEGEGYGLDIANNHYTAFLSRQVGQLERLAFRRGFDHVPYGGNLELNTGGEGHGEPPHIDWGPDYTAAGNYQKLRMTAWSEPPNWEVVRGPLLVEVRRWGFPRSAAHPVFAPSRLHFEVTYRFWAGMPYLEKTVHMEAVKDFEVAHIRDDEWLFWGLSFTDGLWLDRHGKVHEGKGAEDQRDDMWGVGFFNRESHDAFVAIRLQHEAEGIGPIHHGGEPSLGYYGRGQIWCRSPLSQPTRFRPGNTLTHRTAYLATRYPPDGGAHIVEEAHHRLATPLAVGASRLTADRRAGKQRSRPRPSSEAPPLARPGELPRPLHTRGTSEAGVRADAALKEDVWAALHEVEDDQLMQVPSNVVDMGYVYDVRVRDGVVHIVMTMPHRGRSHYQFIANPIRDRLIKLDGVRDCVVEFTWEPAWTVSRLTNAGRKAMGLSFLSRNKK